MEQLMFEQFIGAIQAQARATFDNVDRLNGERCAAYDRLDDAKKDHGAKCKTELRAERAEVKEAAKALKETAEYKMLRECRERYKAASRELDTWKCVEERAEELAGIENDLHDAKKAAAEIARKLACATPEAQ